MESGAGAKKNAFTEIINCISKGKFLGNTNYQVATRDYLSIKLWDIRGTSSQKPYLSLYTCDYLEKSLVSLYEDDSIYDRFFLDVSPNY